MGDQYGDLAINVLDHASKDLYIINKYLKASKRLTCGPGMQMTGHRWWTWWTNLFLST